MGQVAVTMNGRTYRLSCEDGGEKRLKQLADHVAEKVETLAGEFGQIGSDRLVLMAAILVADELFDARAGKDAGSGGISAAPENLKKRAS